MPGSQTAPGRAVLALGSRRSASPSEAATSSAPGIISLSRLNGRPMPPPADASPPTSRPATHGSGPMRFATPSSYWMDFHQRLPAGLPAHSPGHPRPSARRGFRTLCIEASATRRKKPSASAQSNRVDGRDGARP